MLPGEILPAETIALYVDAILDTRATQLPRLECPSLDTARYASLKPTSYQIARPRIEYFFALDLRKCLELLPRLLGSVVEVIRFLGPDRCTLSIVGGNSPDGTDDVLAALALVLIDLDITYTFKRADVDSAEGARIQKLADLRNLALAPLVDNFASSVSADTVVLFLNDVAACAEDILELALQRRNLGADMTCAFDWVYVSETPTFYDVWVSRTLQGDWFFDIPPDGSWDRASNLFWNDTPTRARYDTHLPFQVFSCWNGVTAFRAQPVLEGLRFRASNEDAGECFQGEPQLFCKDLWFRGFGRIAVVPSVNLAYSDEEGKRTKDLKGYTSQLVKGKTAGDDRIQWITEPPEKVLCAPGFDRQSWVPWNETLHS